MTTALLQLLTHPQVFPPSAALTALQKGEINPETTLAEAPDLIARVVQAMEGTEGSDDQLLLIQKLEGFGFDPWQRDKDGFDAFHHALSLQHPGMISWLSTHPRAPKDLPNRRSARDGSHPLLGASFEAAVALLGAGFSAHGHYLDYGDTLLHGTRDPALIRLLLQSGVNPHQQNEAGLSAADMWDRDTYFSVSQRSEIDQLLLQHAPRPKTDLLRGFGRAMWEVGPVITKARLLSAGIHPKTAQIDGLDLPHLMAAEIFNRALKDEEIFSKPRDLNKYLRVMESTLKVMTPIGPDTDPATLQSWRGVATAVSLFIGAIEQASGMASLPEVDFNGKPSAAKSRRQINLIALLGGEEKGKETEDLLAAQGAIRLMQSRGVQNNPAWTTGWILRGARSYLPDFDAWMTPDQENTPLFFGLASMALRGLEDDAWRYRSALKAADPIEEGLTGIPEFFYEQARLVPRGVAIMLAIAHPRAFNEGPRNLMRAIKEDADDGSLSMKDPLLKFGLARWRKFWGGANGNEELDALLDQVEICAKHNDLQVDTPGVSRTRSRRI